jgi:hypothetical protein
MGYDDNTDNHPTKPEFGVYICDVVGSSLSFPYFPVARAALQICDLGSREKERMRKAEFLPTDISPFVMTLVAGEREKVFFFFLIVVVVVMFFSRAL